jgi:ribosome-binding protein aMBF1 (putative translation factor)
MTPAQIKEARQKLGLSVNQMATMIDTDPLSVRRMEGNPEAKTHRHPAPRMVRLIEAYLSGYRPLDWPHSGCAR